MKGEEIEGEVVVLFQIDIKGDVKYAPVIKGLYPELGKLALEAIQQWEFEPYVYRGSPIAIPGSLWQRRKGPHRKADGERLKKGSPIFLR